MEPDRETPIWSVENDACPFCGAEVDSDMDTVLVEQQAMPYGRVYWLTHRACVVGREGVSECEDCKKAVEHVHEGID